MIDDVFDVLAYVVLGIVALAILALIGFVISIAPIPFGIAIGAIIVFIWALARTVERLA